MAEDWAILFRTALSLIYLFLHNPLIIIMMMIIIILYIYTYTHIYIYINKTKHPDVLISIMFGSLLWTSHQSTG